MGSRSGHNDGDEGVCSRRSLRRRDRGDVCSRQLDRGYGESGRRARHEGGPWWTRAARRGHDGRGGRVRHGGGRQGSGAVDKVGRRVSPYVVAAKAP
jgi:hypothetical protein